MTRLALSLWLTLAPAVALASGGPRVVEKVETPWRHHWTGAYWCSHAPEFWIRVERPDGDGGDAVLWFKVDLATFRYYDVGDWAGDLVADWE